MIVERRLSFMASIVQIHVLTCVVPTSIVGLWKYWEWYV